MNGLYDNFNFQQRVVNTPIVYPGSEYWYPPSSRTLTGGGNVDITYKPGLYGNAEPVTLLYRFSPNVSLSLLEFLIFTKTYIHASDSAGEITVYLDSTKFGSSQVANSSPQEIIVRKQTTADFSDVSSMMITVSFAQESNIYVGPFYSNIITCVAHGSKILTPAGYRPVEELQRGDLVQEMDGSVSRVARIIRE